MAESSFDKKDSQLKIDTVGSLLVLQYVLRFLLSDIVM